MSIIEDNDGRRKNGDDYVSNTRVRTLISNMGIDKFLELYGENRTDTIGSFKYASKTNTSNILTADNGNQILQWWKDPDFTSEIVGGDSKNSLSETYEEEPHPSQTYSGYSMFNTPKGFQSTDWKLVDLNYSNTCLLVMCEYYTTDGQRHTGTLNDFKYSALDGHIMRVWVRPYVVSTSSTNRVASTRIHPVAIQPRTTATLIWNQSTTDDYTHDFEYAWAYSIIKEQWGMWFVSSSAIDNVAHGRSNMQSFSGLATPPNYTDSDCFETFPLTTLPDDIRSEFFDDFYSFTQNSSNTKSDTVVCMTYDGALKWATLTFGMQTTPSLLSAQESALGEDCSDPEIYAAVSDDGGITANIVSGLGVGQLPQFKGNPEDFKETGTFKYQSDPSKYPSRPMKPSDTMTYNVPLLNPISCFNTAYALNLNTINRLSNWVTNMATPNEVGDLPKKFVTAIQNQYQRIIDAIPSIRLYPFDVQKHDVSGVAFGPMYMCGQDCTELDENLKAYRVLPRYNAWIDMGSVKLTRTQTNTFIDYAPYTKYSLYIPYHATVDIDPIFVVGKTVTVRASVDLSTGASIAVVYSDGDIVKYVNGTMGIEVPISKVDSISYSKAIEQLDYQSQSALIQGATSIGMSALQGSSGIPTALTQGVQTARTLKQIDKQKSMTFPSVSFSGGTPCCNTFMNQRCHLFEFKSEPINFDGHRYSEGIPCEQYVPIGNVYGYCQIDSPEIEESFGLTDSEISELSSILQSGFHTDAY